MIRPLWPAVILAAAVTACSNDPADPGPVPDSVVTLRHVAGGLADPVFLAAPGHDSARVFVLLQAGAIRVIRNDTLLATPFLDLTGTISAGGERGLLGMAFDPQYASNGRFYLNFTDASGDTRIVRYLVSANLDVAATSGAETLLTVAQPFANHNGGMIAFGPDGYLYIGMGDGGSGGDPQDHGQNMSSLLGKMLRLNVSGTTGYSIPPDNPFVATANARPEIWASGLRNPWRFSFDRLTGDQYIADVGQASREEINVQPAGTGGQNYGWRLMEGTLCYIPGCTPLGLTLPVHDYGREDGCSVTGGYVYRGSIAELRGHYFYSDYCGAFIRSFRWTGGTASQHRDWTTVLGPGAQVSSFGEDARGELYILVHTGAGAVYRIDKR